MSINCIREKLFKQGLDIVHAFNPQGYNAFLDSNIKYSNLIKLSIETTSTSNALLIGNTKVIWKPFLEWCKCQSDTIPKDPLDKYVINSIQYALQGLKGYQVFYSFEVGERLVHFQALCNLVGLATFNQVLNIKILL